MKEKIIKNKCNIELNIKLIKNNLKLNFFHFKIKDNYLKCLLNNY